MQKWQPPEGGILKPITVFDYYEGANFNLIIKKVKAGKVNGKDVMMPNYDDSSFDSVSCVGTDEEIEKIVNSLFGIKEFHSPTLYKSYEELKEKHDRVIGQTISTNEKTDKNTERVSTSVTAPVASAENEPKATENEENDTGDIFSGTDESFFQGLQTE
jgi:hypothetical protein